jgi:two-component system sensor histidine kinase and response regulator WspE
MAKLRSVIIEKKLATKKIAQQLSDAELTEFIFLPNFTTKDKVSRLSGRGVGLDVVHSTIKQLRGSISLSSVAGSGSLFELILPLSLSLTRAITCLINDELYAVPLVNVEYVTKIKQTELLEIDERQYIVADDKRIDIVSAQQVLDLTEPSRPQRDLPTLILQGTKGVYGIVVDRLLGVKELIVHPISPRLGKLRSINSAAITEDGIPILILDKEDIIQSIDHLLSGNRLHKIDRTDDLKARDKSKKILVVDDSATVREVERKLLSDSGYAVTTAEDGLDAWNTVKDEKFDLIITDIDMPNMDGIEFLLQVREDHDLHDIPVIIVSYKDRKEDRLKGLNAGADYYLTKGSFQDQTLLDAIFDLVGSPTDD